MRFGDEERVKVDADKRVIKLVGLGLNLRSAIGRGELGGFIGPIPSSLP